MDVRQIIAIGQRDRNSIDNPLVIFKNQQEAVEAVLEHFGRQIERGIDIDNGETVLILDKLDKANVVQDSYQHQPCGPWTVMDTPAIWPNPMLTPGHRTGLAKLFHSAISAHYSLSGAGAVFKILVPETNLNFIAQLRLFTTQTHPISGGFGTLAVRGREGLVHETLFDLIVEDSDPDTPLGYVIVKLETGVK